MTHTTHWSRPVQHLGPVDGCERCRNDATLPQDGRGGVPEGEGPGTKNEALRGVHNHRPWRPMCNEREVDGQIRGACLNDDGTPRGRESGEGETT